MRLFSTNRLECMLLFTIVLSAIILSCNNESELLFESEGVLEEEEFEADPEGIGENLIVDDVFTIISGNIEVLDVLENDNFPDTLEVSITDVSKPSNGNVALKNNTIEYSAPDTSTEIIDTFTYTVEINYDSSLLYSETGNVSVTTIADTIPDPAPAVNNSHFFTEQAKMLLKQRFENGYVAGAGFNNDIAKVIAEASKFMADPDAHRPTFGGSGATVPNKGHYLHTTAVYAYAIDDVSMANAVATELLGIVNSNDLFTSYWASSNRLRWDNAPGALWIQCTKAKKMKDSYNFIKNLQTVLTPEDKTEIEGWFKRFAELAFAGISNRINVFFGSGWTVDNFPNPYYSGDEFGINSKGQHTGRPVQDAQGNDLYIMAAPQDIYNNRNFDVIGFIHSWAVEAEDLAKETYCRNFFKVFIKYGIFPDGTIWELKRNGNSSDLSGVAYGDTTLEVAIRMAHTDAMADHFPNDRLYDYKTTDGILNGSTKISDTPYAGTSTTDGSTEKSLKTFIKGQSNYLRNKANGGWSDVRFYVNADNVYVPLDATGVVQPSSHVAMANLYYKDQDLEDFYTYNTGVGYPMKQSISGGYNAGAWDKDGGSWGNMIFGSMWYGQENNFFN